MKKILISGLTIALIVALAEDAFSQRRRRTTTRPAVTQPAVVDTTPAPPPPPPPPPPDTIPVKSVVAGRRPATTVTGNLIQDKVPLAYDNIRIDDQVYKQVIWRVIDTRERINLPFKYEADEDNGNQRFINILLKHIKEGDITAFDNSNDRFTTPLSVDAVAKSLVGSSYDVDVPDLEKDPTGTLGITKRVTIREEFNEESIRSYAVKEEIIFDRETSRLHFRILGIAPMKTIFNDDGTERATFRLFWVYYPELRPYLAKYEAYNPRNMAARMSWEEVFESRYFASYIYKSTLNNPFDKPIEGFQKDPLFRLLEGEKIKETIFNWEQDQWSY
ncbi:MAG: gliding motility protein GldN [Chitinophagaceae bacterium]|nr:gliding motility protein GldN [Chitinophagaceae bacterium]